MKKKVLSILIKLGFTALLFVLLFRPQTFGLDNDVFGGVTPMKMWEELRGTDMAALVPWLLFALAVKLAGMMAGVLRWRLLLKGQGLTIPFGYLVQSWFVGRAIGIFLPGTIGLDGYRLYDSALYTAEPVKCATVVAVEKLIGFVALTFLLFLTFPLGFQLLNINAVVFAAIVLVLAAFVAVAFLLLLNPRVIQILVAVIPTPGKVANILNKLGLAATAYSGNRALLLKATFLGLLVHLGTCFMYFGTMMAIRAENTSLWDILFASPVMIYGTVLGPSIGGEGIREIVFVTLLSGTAGAAAAALFSHLGWWVGEFVPFVIGVVVYILRSRKPKDEMAQELARMRSKAAAAEAQVLVHLTPEEIAMYRRKIVNSLLGGALAGLIGGAITGLAEANWVLGHHGGYTEWSAYWWGPLVYGAMFLWVGLGIAAGLTFLYLLMKRFLSPKFDFAMTLGLVLAMAFLAIGRFCYRRDVLGERALTMAENLNILLMAAGLFVAATLLALLVTWPFRLKRGMAIVAGVGGYVVLVIIGLGLSTGAPGRVAPEFAPAKKATGPNIILMVADALRADYLPAYSESTPVETPALEKFAQDSIFFTECFSHASWTKPSFATIFSGRYPEAHTATSKISELPEEVTTFAEVFSEHGYYAKGFSNNPNITRAFNFDQGFTDYIDLKPDLYFFAKPSASKLTGYDGLRKIWNKLAKRLGGKINVTRFYQPAEVVTREALAWLDSPERPADAPFILFMHYMDPHDPFMNHDNPGEGYARVQIEHPNPDEYLEKMRHAYYTEIEYMDAHIGAFIEELRERGLYEDSVIIFTADHGEEFYDHEGWWHGQTLYDEVVHVPLMLHLPGGAMAGKVNANFARHIDIAPTMLSLAGLQKPEEMPGMALVAEGVFKNDFTGQVYAENDLEGIVLQALRTRTEKLILANEGN
ncbi:MAG: sulfatase-like hydrolase/transferase, partial [Candidatus Hydrogenedentota bacterium]